MAIVSSHTLNGVDGTHAGGVPVRLINLRTGAALFDTAMDAGGRLSETVDLAGADPGERYELVFDTGAYWASRGASGAIDEIVLRFRMPDPDARYHRPLILSPHSYSCWASAPE